MRSPHVQSVEGLDSFAVAGLCEPVAVTLGDDEVGVVHEPVHGCGRDRWGQDLVEPARV